MYVAKWVLTLLCNSSYKLLIFATVHSASIGFIGYFHHFYTGMKRIVQQSLQEWLTGESEPNSKLMDDHQCNSTTMSKSILNITLIVPVKITQFIQNAVQYQIPNLKCAEYTTIFVL